MKKYAKEKDLQAAVKHAIKHTYGPNAWFYHPCDRIIVGIPDCIICFYGMFIAVELKFDLSKNPLTKLQEHNMTLIADAKGFTLQADTVGSVIEGLEFIRQKYSLSKRLT